MTTINYTESFQPATEKQFSFIRTLISERELDETDAYLVEESRDLARKGALSRAAASSLIDVLTRSPRKEQPVAEQAPLGMHVENSGVFKVVESQAGRRYAKRLTRNPDTDKWTFEYSPGDIKHLSTETVMSAEAAAKFGATYGICCNCGRLLTNESSVHYGYGPVCAERNGWPHGDVPDVPAPSTAEPTTTTASSEIPEGQQVVTGWVDHDDYLQASTAAIVRQNVAANDEAQSMLAMLDE